MVPVHGFPNYMITEDGKVFSIPKNKFVKEKPGGYKKYPRVELWRDGIRHHHWVHRLVCAHYVGSCTGKHVHHGDGDPTNNHAVNLKPLTPKQHKVADQQMRERRARLNAEALKVDCPF